MAKKKLKLAVVEGTKPYNESQEDFPEIGKWYWVDSLGHSDDETYLCCVTHIGSNYVRLEGISWRVRIHFDDFWRTCKYEPDSSSIIKGKIDLYNKRVQVLLREVHGVAARLGVTPSPVLTNHTETEALVRRSGEPVPEYRKALVKAKEDKLPELFREIKANTERMEKWMLAEVIPLKAQKDGLDGMIGAIDRRVLAVDLYAGLSEEAVQIKKGKPAKLSEPVRLMQRLCFMDEECLANYRAGGMEFKDIKEFDRWLAKKENRDRILPFPRCIVSFRVRRDDKERRAVNLSDFIHFSGLRELDKKTFLYIRNGNQLWRINTAIDFGGRLFPDYDKQLVSSGQKIWAYKFSNKVEDKLISDAEYQAIKEKEESDIEAWVRLSMDKKKELWHKKPTRFGRESDRYVPFEKSSVYYDDIAAIVKRNIDEYNRVSMIIQGILDRSTILNPHPPWKIWTEEGFNQALRLVYDESRALVAGEKPDFEAYRDRLNQSLRKGSITVGQERQWLRKEAAKENRRLDMDWRNKSDHRHEEFQPYGNPGPGELARVEKYYPRVKKCGYAWMRDRLTFVMFGDNGPIRTTFSCSNKCVLNVDAYKPGDFKIFFNDPRTRMEYLKWAPLLLVAEEYHAGNRKVKDGEKVSDV